MSDLNKPRKRRGFLALAGGVVLIAGLPKLWAALKPRPDALAHPTVPGFRKLEDGKISSSYDPFIGLSDPNEDRINPVEISNICQAIFKSPTAPGAVPVAVFTDINCPYCRVLEGWVEDLPEDQVTVTWHDLPLLGPGSVAGARAIGAARQQGAEQALRKRLHRTRFQPDAAYLTALSEGLGLDTARMLADRTHPEVEQRIGESLGLAQLFGIPGTPALIVGHTLAIGALTRSEFDQLLKDAQSARADWPCGQ